MIIVSQVKRNIINFDNVESIYIVADLNGTGKIPYKIYYETSTQSEELGQYATEERAKEVLQEIEKKYLEYIELGSPTKGPVSLHTIPKVYEMPEE